MHPPDSAKQQRLLMHLISRTCTTEQIRRLLREAKTRNSRVLLSGTTEELIGSLVSARKLGALSDEELFELLRQGEENGRHYSFFFEVAPSWKSRCADQDWLIKRASNAFPRHFGAPPKLIDKPMDRVLGDVRIDPGDRGAFTLVVKQYSGRMIEHETEREEFTEGEDVFIRRISKVEYERLVATVRIHSHGIVEIRVPTGARESRSATLQELAELRELQKVVFATDVCAPVDFSRALAKLVAGRSARGVDYKIEGVRALDGGATAEFGAPMEGQDLFASERHEAAVAQYNEFEKMDVYFQSPFLRTPPRPEIRCQMCIYGNNVFRLGSRLEAIEAEFVTKRLLRLAGAGQ